MYHYRILKLLLLNCHIVTIKDKFVMTKKKLLLIIQEYYHLI